MAATMGAITLPSFDSFLQVFPAPKSPSCERPKLRNVQVNMNFEISNYPKYVQVHGPI